MRPALAMTRASLAPLRVVFCTSGGLFGFVTLDRLLSSSRIEVVGLIVSSRILRRRYGFLRGGVEQIRRSGPAYALYLFGVTTVADLLGRLPPFGSVRSLARKRSIPRLITKDINSTQGLAFLAARQPDLLISAFFNQRIGETARTLPRAGAVNIHPSLLPAFRGVDPVFFAKLRSAEPIGVSLHRLTDSFDNGGILAQTSVAVPRGDSVFKTTARLFRRGADLLLENLDAITLGAVGKPQGPGGGYDSWPTPEEVRALGRRGERLLPMEDLWGLARGRDLNE